MALPVLAHPGIRCFPHSAPDDTSQIPLQTDFRDTVARIRLCSAVSSELCAWGRSSRSTLSDRKLLAALNHDQGA
jgi:hypothetical protein